MYKLVARDGLSGRLFRFALIAILSFAMCITGFSSSFYAFAEDAAASKEAKEKEVAVTSESKDRSENENEAAASEEASSKETAPAEKAEPVTEKAEPASEIAEPASEKTEAAPEETEPVSEDVVSADNADNEENSQDSEVTSQADETSQNVSVQEPTTESQLDQAETKELTTETEKSAPNKTVARKTALMSSAAAPTESGEAKIGNKTYASVQEAIEAAADGDIVELIKDVAIKTTIEIIGKSITVSDDGNARVIRNEDGTSAPLFTVRKGAELTLNGSSVENLKLQGGTSNASNSATAILVEGIANVKKVLIDGGIINNASNSGAINVKKGGTLNMSDGVVENTVINRGGYGTAAVVVDENAHFEMSGGEIRNNINYSNGTNHAGGVVLAAWGNSQSTMNLSGGKIIGNQADNGGGIYMTGSSKLNMTGGAVDGNRARNIGGGICVSGIWMSSKQNSEFIFNGGSISNNRARTAGGIYVNTDTAYLKKGYIEGNYASMLGGGVYVSVAPRVLHVSKAVITENTSSIGGGLWACPTGNIHLKVTDGVAVYNNSAKDAGDDVVNISYNSIYASTLTIPDRMLGGGEVKWYADGSILYSDYGYARSNSARFDDENHGDELHFENQYGAVALKSVTTDAAIARANEEATLFIRNNYGWRGGGIGTNGDLTLANMDYKDWKLVAEKKWEDIEGTDDKEVKVFLKIGGQILDSITLNKDNEWKGEFNGLPDPSSLTDENITIVEGEMVEDENGNMVFKETSQYSVRYERVVMADDSVIYVLVTNSPLPPEEPEEEETVTEEATEEETVEEKKVVEDDSDEVKSVYKTPEKTEEAVIKTADSKEVKTVKQVKAAKSSGVPTGDSSNVFIYIIALMIAAASAASIVYRRRKEQ